MDKYKRIGGIILSSIIFAFAGYGYVNDMDGYGMFLFFGLLVVLISLGND